MNRRGLTLIELVLALGLFALLSLMVVQLLDSTMRVWSRAEGQRYAISTHTALSTQLLEELDQLASGELGELLIDWEVFDTDGDGIVSRPLQRLRFVRRAGAADLVRLGHREVDPRNPDAARIEGGELPLLEVVYCVLPKEHAGVLTPTSPGNAGDCVLWRGERLLENRTRPSCFSRDFFVGGYPPPGGAEPLQGGILWFEVLCAGRGTNTDRGWNTGSEPSDAARAWDSRGGQRLAIGGHRFNDPYAVMPAYRGEPLFPRRVRLALEIVAPQDERRRPTLAEPLAPDDLEMVVADPHYLPEAGTLVLVGEEWVEIGHPSRRTSVLRAQRGTAPRPHRAGTPLQVGRRFEREIAVPLHTEDWRS